jgi:hypothetical protein
MRSYHDIITDIAFFQPEKENWIRLSNLLDELWLTGDQDKVITNLFNVFEKYPEHDGSGVLWTLLHGLETLKGYELELLESLHRQPSLMSVIMIKRILNSGVERIGQVELKDVLIGIKMDKRTPGNVKRTLQ